MVSCYLVIFILFGGTMVFFAWTDSIDRKLRAKAIELQRAIRPSPSPYPFSWHDLRIPGATVKGRLAAQIKAADHRESKPHRHGAPPTMPALVRCGECKWWKEFTIHLSIVEKGSCDRFAQEDALLRPYNYDGLVVTHRTFGCVQGVRK